jgi:hypothetical protein
MTDLAALKAANARRWAIAKLTRDFSIVARHLVAPDAGRVTRPFLRKQACRGP